MPLLVPLLIGGSALFGLGGASGFVTGSATSDKLGAALQITGLVVGLFLIIVLMQRFGLLKLK
ncbi:MAG: hypothetical protein KTR20_14145 [Cellvibrionaceae bacterium]|nr:hypothetical protein [Cellvibrionaceae bacterium]